MPAITTPARRDARFKHGVYPIVRTMLFPKRERHLSGLSRAYTDAIIAEAAERHGELGPYHAAAIKSAQFAHRVLLWCEKDARQNGLTNSDGTLKASIAEIAPRMLRELRSALKDLGLDQRAGDDALDVQAVLHQIHREQAASVATGRDNDGKDGTTIVQSGNDALDAMPEAQSEPGGGA